jgi:hypothetical protein
MSIHQAIQSVLRRPAYAATSLLVAFLIFTASTILIPNFAFVQSIFGSASLDLIEKVGIISALYGSIGTNFTVFSASVTIALSLLVGVNFALLVYALKRRIRGSVGAGSISSASGIFGGLFGVGCAACGSLALTAVLPGVFGSLVATLPYGGEEIGILGLLLVGVSIYYLARDIATPAGTCPV